MLKGTHPHTFAIASWLRFRLRTLLVLMAVIATALAFSKHEFREWRRRERARQQRAQLLNMGDYPGDIPLRMHLDTE